MDKFIYALCALTAAACTTLLLRSYLRTRFRLLMWSAACFAGLTLNNVLLVLDRVVFPTVDLSMWRVSTALAAVVLLLCGLIFESNS
ncbi:MAG: hypothetical protein KF891_04085 [Rhizobacter sp.]|nr:hypothetical protein [Rhizobacter sp.]